MGWETRGKGHYYYVSRREGGHIVKEYIGEGPAAKIAATLADEARSRRAAATAARRASQRRLRKAREASWDLERECLATITCELDELGYHRVNGGPWRRCRFVEGRRKRRFVRPRGQRLEEPTIDAAIAAWAEALAAGEPELAAGWRYQAGTILTTIAKPSDTDGLALMAAEVAISWLALEYARGRLTTAMTSVSSRSFEIAKRSKKAAETRHARSLRELAIVRKIVTEVAQQSPFTSIPNADLRIHHGEHATAIGA